MVAVMVTAGAHPSSGGESQPLGLVVAASQADPLQAGVLHDLLVDVVTQRAQLNLDEHQLPIVLFDASRHSDVVSLDKLGIEYNKLVCVGVCSMSGGLPVRVVSLQGPVVDPDASTSVSMRRVQYLLGLEGITPPGPEATVSDALAFDFRSEHGKVVHAMRGSVLTPLQFWGELAQFQPPPGATGPYGTPDDDALSGHPRGYGLRQLGKVARRYLRFDSLEYQQPPVTDHIGVQSGTFTDSQSLTDASLGLALFDLRSRFEADLRSHLHLGRH